MIKIEAFQIAEALNLKKFKAEFVAQPNYASNWELFYLQEGEKYVYLLGYGVVVFANYDQLEKSEFLRYLKPYLEEPLPLEFSDDYLVDVTTNTGRPIFRYDSVIISKFNEEVLRIIMLNVAQSVALDYYENLTYSIISTTNKYVDELEKFGRVKITKKALLKFIGRTLNVKNGIVDNLYILDDPGAVWEDEYLEMVNKGMKDALDIQLRFRDLDYKLKTVRDNLSIFMDLLQHRESKVLEWIIIILILIEVVNVFFREIF
ncbi:MAG TPA: RMD1 family protein [Cytophagales bacterium]|nr:RMD1 family protein [Cytophagales bacterium]